jgi:hypothetical protein
MFAAPLSLPLMWTELAVASWETVWHRTALMATGKCSQAEYESMVHEKMQAMTQAGMALMTGQDAADVMHPFLSKARANAERLRTA